MHTGAKGANHYKIKGVPYNGKKFYPRYEGGHQMQGGDFNGGTGGGGRNYNQYDTEIKYPKEGYNINPQKGGPDDFYPIHEEYEGPSGRYHQQNERGFKYGGGAGVEAEEKAGGDNQFTGQQQENEDELAHAHCYNEAQCKDESCTYCCQPSINEENMGEYMQQAAQQRSLHEKALKMGGKTQKMNNEARQPKRFGDDLRNLKLY